MNQVQTKPEALKQVYEGMQAESGKLIVFDLHTLAYFRDERPDVQILSDMGTARLVLFAFKAGQQLQEHRTSSQILVQTLRGRVIDSSYLAASYDDANRLWGQLGRCPPWQFERRMDLHKRQNLLLQPQPSYFGIDSGASR